MAARGGRHRSSVVATGAECACSMCCAGSGCWRPRSLRGGLADGSCCWRALSGICWPSGGWRRARSSLYLACARRFVDGLAPDRELAGLVARRRDGRGAARGRGRVGQRGAELRLGAAVRFCGSAFIEGLVGSDLSRAALLVRGRSSSPLPRGISRADARALLGSCDRRQALGRRDYAMIIMLLRLGLRRGEVAGLTA